MELLRLQVGVKPWTLKKYMTELSNVLFSASLMSEFCKHSFAKSKFCPFHHDQCENDADAFPNSASWTSSSVLSARRSAALEKEVEHLRYQLDQVSSKLVAPLIDDLGYRVNTGSPGRLIA